jgi:hypothetical protein
MPAEMAWRLFAIQDVTRSGLAAAAPYKTLLAGPEAAEIVLRLPREFNDRSRRACSRGHERRCGVRSAIGRCPL